MSCDDDKMAVEKESHEKAYNLLVKATRDQLSPEEVLERAKAFNDNSRAALADCAAALCVEEEENSEEALQRQQQKLAACLNLLIESRIISRDDAYTSLEDGMLKAMGIVGKDVKNLAKRSVTSELYTYGRNDLRQDAQAGFAMLINRIMVADDSNAKPEDLAQAVTRITGEYNIQLWRVVEMAIIATLVRFCEGMSDFQTGLLDVHRAVLNMTTVGHITTLLGLQFQMYAGKEEKAPGALGDMAVVFIKEGYAEVAGLLPHLWPKLQGEQSMEAISSNRMQVKTARAKHEGLQHISQAKSSTEEKEERVAKEQAIQEEAEAEQKEVDMNQHIALVASMLNWCSEMKGGSVNETEREGMLDSADEMLERMSQMRISVAKHEKCRKAIKTHLRETMEGALSILARQPMNSEEAIKEGNLSTRFFYLLESLGTGLCFEHDAVVDATKVLRACVLAGDKELRADAMNMLGMYIIPSLMQPPADGKLALEVHNLIYPLEDNNRLSIYKDANRVVNFEMLIPEVTFTRNVKQKEVEKELKRITTNLKQSEKHFMKVAEYAQTMPLVVVNSILNNAERFIGLVGPLTDCVLYTNRFTKDVLACSIVERLIQKREDTLTEDGTEVSTWLLALAQVNARVSALSPGRRGRSTGTMDYPFGTVLNYMLKELTRARPKQVCIIKEFFKTMVGVELVENVGEEGRKALSGGVMLRTFTALGSQAVKKISTRDSADGVEKIQDAIMHLGRRFPSEMLLSLSRTILAVKADSEIHSLRHFCYLAETCHEIFILLVNVLERAYTHKEYSRTVLPMRILRQVNMPMSMILHVHRKLLRDDKMEVAACDLQTNIEDKEQEYISTMAALRRMCPTSDSDNEVEDDMEILKTPNHYVSDNFLWFAWSMRLHDLELPTALYDSTTRWAQERWEKLKSPSHDNESEEARLERSHMRHNFRDAYEELPKEKQEHIKRVDNVKAIMDRHAPHWILKPHSGTPARASSPTAKGQMNEAQEEAQQEGQWKSEQQRNDISLWLLRFLFLPRLRMTMEDALYCGKLVKEMAERCDGFSLKEFMQKFIGRFMYLLASSTDKQGDRLSQFLRSVLFEAEAVRKSPEEFKRKGLTAKSYSTKLLTRSNFLTQLQRLSNALANAFQLNINSSNWVSARNALVGLSIVSDVFPIDRENGERLKACAERKMKAEECSRDDLMTLAEGVRGKLHTVRHRWVEASMAFSDCSSEEQTGNETKGEATESDANEPIDTNLQVNEQIEAKEDAGGAVEQIDWTKETASEETQTGVQNENTEGQVKDASREDTTLTQAGEEAAKQMSEPEKNNATRREGSRPSGGAERQTTRLEKDKQPTRERPNARRVERGRPPRNGRDRLPRERQEKEERDRGRERATWRERQTRGERSRERSRERGRERERERERNSRENERRKRERENDNENSRERNTSQRRNRSHNQRRR